MSTLDMDQALPTFLAESRELLEEMEGALLSVLDSEERQELVMINEALGKIQQGLFGVCEDCDEPIGLKRLLARPTATLSVEAQERRELKQKMFGD